MVGIFYNFHDHGKFSREGFVFRQIVFYWRNFYSKYVFPFHNDFSSAQPGIQRQPSDKANSTKLSSLYKLCVVFVVHTAINSRCHAEIWDEFLHNTWAALPHICTVLLA